MQFRELISKLSVLSTVFRALKNLLQDHSAIINDLERGISLIANRLDNISSHKVHKFTQTNDNSCSSLPLTKTPCSLNLSPALLRTVSHPSRSTVSHSSVAPSKSAPRSHPPRAVYPPAICPHLPLDYPFTHPLPSPVTLPLLFHHPLAVPLPPIYANQRCTLFSDIIKAPPPRLNPAVPGVAVTRGNSVGKTVLIMGDSNTRHVHLDGEGISETRIPTYVVEDIDPHKCNGFDIVWLHVGVNSLKPRNCGDLRGVRKKLIFYEQDL